MQEEFIINSVLSWKLCKRTYNKQGYFFIINSAFPSVAGITALRSGRLLVVANAALNLQPNTLFLKKKNNNNNKKNLKSNLRKNLDNNFMKNLDNFLSKKFTTKLFKIIIYGRESWCNSTPKFHPLRLMFQPHPFKLAQKSKLTWLAKNPDRVAAGKILEEYNRLYKTVKVISDKLTHPCVMELSSRCIPLLRLIYALFKENQRESRLSKDLALTHSNTHIHHFPITFVLNSCCYLIWC